MTISADTQVSIMKQECLATIKLGSSQSETALIQKHIHYTDSNSVDRKQASQCFLTWQKDTKMFSSFHHFKKVGMQKYCLSHLFKHNLVSLRRQNAEFGGDQATQN